LPGVEFEDWELERMNGSLGVVTTNGRTGTPHSAPVGIRVEEGALVFETSSDSVKLRNIERDPRIAILVFGQPKWGVLVQGRAEILSKGEGGEQAPVRMIPDRKTSWRRKEG
jgi:general stress protein 26